MARSFKTLSELSCSWATSKFDISQSIPSWSGLRLSEARRELPLASCCSPCPLTSFDELLASVSEGAVWAVTLAKQRHTASVGPSDGVALSPLELTWTC